MTPVDMAPAVRSSRRTAIEATAIAPGQRNDPNGVARGEPAGDKDEREQ